MKKTVLVIGVLLIVLIASAAIGIAVSKFDFAADNEDLQFAHEKPDVEKAINKQLPFIQKNFSEKYKEWGLKDKSQIPTSLGKPYKVYPVKNNFIEIFQKEKTFVNCFDNNPMYWEVPLIDKDGEVMNTADVAFFEEKWQTIGVGLVLSTADVSFSADRKQLSDLLTKANVKDVKSIKHLRTGTGDVIYVVSDSGEFLIPMSLRPDLLKGLDMRAVYRADDFVDLAKEYFKPLTGPDKNGLIVGD